MTAPTISEYLSYANLQMAAETFIRDEATNRLNNTGSEYVQSLVNGNNHASRFTAAEAQKFTTEWEVLEQRANTKTGFSGTLFRNRNTRETVMSFRSTEFIDDAARDNKATNELEINATGFAWGQIADMQQWYAELKADSQKLGSGQSFSVTGYSLGGHLATAFNLLNAGAAQRVVTFNGAGVGRLKDGTLATALAEFNTLRASTDALAARCTEAGLATAYRKIRTDLASGQTTAAAAQVYLKHLYDPVYGSTLLMGSQAKRLLQALENIEAIGNEATRVATLVAGGTGSDASTHPKTVLPRDIAGMDLNYQLALQYAGLHTESASRIAGAQQGFGDKQYASRLDNQYDVVGDTSPSVVANSQWHCGQDIRIGIEDQPLHRGVATWSVAADLIARKGPDLLMNNYAENDFGDTHSLVLLVDSLSVQKVLLSLLPEGQRNTAGAQVLLRAIYYAATDQKRVDGALLFGSSQGQAEGNLLESVVNELAEMVLGPQSRDRKLRGNPNGGTWARTQNQDGYTGRDLFFQRLEEIRQGIDRQGWNGKFDLKATSGRELAGSARNNFDDYLALRMLSCFSLQTTQALQSVQNAYRLQWGSAYTNWNADRTALTGGTATGAMQMHITDRWLADRAAMLARKNWFNLTNNKALDLAYNRFSMSRGSTPAYIFEDVLYEDIASGYKIRLGAVTDTTRHFLFGDEEANTLTGRGAQDHLYGGGGNDILNGQGGNDYLEGNAGDDKLEGGAGNDTLVGCAGSDTYQFDGNFGNDVVIDSDGLGKLVCGSGAAARELNGGTKVANNVWESADKSLLFTLNGADLIISSRSGQSAASSQGTITVRDWRAGNLGLSLRDAPVVAPPSAAAAVEFDLQTRSGQSHYLGHRGQYRNQSQSIKNAAVALNFGTTSNPVWRSSYAFGGNADDLIEGGNVAPVSNMVMGGGAGNDRLYATTATSLQAAIARGDNPQTVAVNSSRMILDGGAGNDLLIGGDARDVLFGGEGDDTIVGGAGSDVIIADGNRGGLLNGAKTTFNYAGEPETMTTPLIADGGPAEVGSSAMLHIDHSGLNLGTVSSSVDGVGQYHTQTQYAVPETRYFDPMFSMDYIAMDAVIDKDIRGMGYSIEQFSWYGRTYGGLLTTAQTLGARTTTESRVALSTNKFTGNDVIYAGAGDDVVNAGAGDDIVYAGSDNDSVAGYEGNDYIDGGSGNDWLMGDAEVTGIGDGTTTERVEHLYSVNLVTRYVLDASKHGRDTIFGGDGRDNIFGGGKDDLLYGGNGNDLIFGDDGEGAISGTAAGNDVLEGGAGNDELFAGAGQDALLGGDGNDFLLGDWQQDDGLGGGADHLDGGAGDDTLFGAAGDDVLLGGDGDDILRGDATAVALLGAVEYDTGGEGASVVYSAASGDDHLDGGAGNDGLYGDAGDDLLMGGEGDDHLTGGTGNDRLQGGQGGDELLGGAGNDVLEGGAGIDYLDGGAGDDTYVVGPQDAAYVERGRASTVESIHDTQGTNTLEIRGIRLEDISVVRGNGANGASSVYICFPGGTSDVTNRVHIDGGTTNRTIAWLKFQDQTIDFATFVNKKLKGKVDLSVAQNSKQLLGGASGDTLRLSGNGNLVMAGRDNDTIVVSGSGNTIKTNLGDGDDVITGDSSLTASGNTLLFGTGIGRDDLLISRAADGATRIEVKGGNTSVTIRGGGIDSVQFSDGSPAMDLSSIAQSTSASLKFADPLLAAQKAEDKITYLTENLDDNAPDSRGNARMDADNHRRTVVSAGRKDDTVVTGQGNSATNEGTGQHQAATISGSDAVNAQDKDAVAAQATSEPVLGTGHTDDQYQFARGDGQRSISDDAGQDTLQIEDTRSDQLWFTQVGYDLSINVLGTQDCITLKNWYDGSNQYHVEQIKTSDGKMLLDSQVHNLVQAMASFSPPPAGQTTLAENYQSALVPVLAVNWQ